MITIVCTFIRIHIQIIQNFKLINSHEVAVKLYTCVILNVLRLMCGLISITY